MALRGDFLQTHIISVKNAQNLVTSLLLLRAKNPGAYTRFTANCKEAILQKRFGGEK